jgi:hypothetical protein
MLSLFIFKISSSKSKYYHGAKTITDENQGSEVISLDTEELDKFLRAKLESEVYEEWGSGFRESGPVTCEMIEQKGGKWLFIKALVNYTGVTYDPSTDRLSGDPEDVHAWYTWIGLLDAAPKKPKTPKELEDWAYLSTYYKLTFRDVQYPGPFGFHEGRLVKDFSPEDGIAEIYVVTERRFQDEAPLSKVALEKIDLNRIEKAVKSNKQKK